MKKLLSLVVALSILLTGCAKFTKETNEANEANEESTGIVLPLTVEEIKVTNVDDVVEKIEEAGFTNVSVEVVQDLDPDEYDVQFINEITIDSQEENEDQRYEPDAQIVITSHETYVKYTLSVSLNCHQNLFFDKYDVDVYFDNEKIDTIQHGKEGVYSLSVKEGDHQFTLYKSGTGTNEATIDIEDVQSDIDAIYNISCENSSIEVNPQSINRKVELNDQQIKMPYSSSDYEGKNYEEVVDELENIGFTNITAKVNYDIIFGFTAEGSVSKVTISDQSFNQFEIHDQSDPIVVTYSSNFRNNPKYQEEESAESDEVVYSTNSEDTIKNGDSGIYAYKREMTSYNLYYIIDFDEGYVYYFTDSNEGTTCDKVKIDSGTLNDRVIITYQDDTDTWQEALYFRSNQPETLIWEDYSGKTYAYSCTDLDRALEIRDTKTIVEY